MRWKESAIDVAERSIMEEAGRIRVQFPYYQQCAIAYAPSNDSIIVEPIDVENDSNLRYLRVNIQNWIDVHNDPVFIYGIVCPEETEYDNLINYVDYTQILWDSRFDEFADIEGCEGFNPFESLSQMAEKLSDGWDVVALKKARKAYVHRMWR